MENYQTHRCSCHIKMKNEISVHSCTLTGHTEFKHENWVRKISFVSLNFRAGFWQGLHYMISITIHMGHDTIGPQMSWKYILWYTAVSVFHSTALMCTMDCFSCVPNCYMCSAVFVSCVCTKLWKRISSLRITNYLT